MNKTLLRNKGDYKPEKSSRASLVPALIRFANAEVKQLREGDRLNLLEDLRDFASAGPGGLELKPEEEIDQLFRDSQGHARLLDFQMDVRSLLQTIAGTQTVLDPQTFASRYFGPEWSSASVSASARVGIATDPRTPPRVVFYGKFLDLLYIQAAVRLLIVRDAEVARLRMCPECAKVFLRSRKQRYCTRQCVNRANMRAWLKSQKGKTSHRASSQRTYAKRIRQQTHARVKIQQRNRQELKMNVRRGQSP